MEWTKVDFIENTHWFGDDNQEDACIIEYLPHYCKYYCDVYAKDVDDYVSTWTWTLEEAKQWCEETYRKLN